MPSSKVSRSALHGQVTINQDLSGTFLINALRAALNLPSKL